MKRLILLKIKQKERNNGKSDAKISERCSRGGKNKVLFGVKNDNSQTVKNISIEDLNELLGYQIVY